MMKRRLGFQALLHFAGRGGSAIFSFLLFALIGSNLDSNDAQRVFFFLFALGFSISFLRVFLHLAAGISGAGSAKEKMSGIARGFRAQYRIAVLLLPLMIYIFWTHLDHVGLSLLAGVFLLFAMVDADLLRSIAGQAPLFSSVFAIGSLVACVAFLLAPVASLELAVICLLLQWLPTIVFNLASASKLWRLQRGMNSYKQTSARREDVSYLASIVLLAAFDGIVLNSPFLGLYKPSVQAALDLSVALRVFVASLAMLPLLLHWTNSVALTTLSNAFSVGQAAMFSMVLFAGGLITGTLFFVAYRLVGDQAISQESVLCYLILLFSYSVYSSQMRLVGPHVTSTYRVVTLLGALILFGVIAVIISEVIRDSAITVSILQAGALLSGSAAFLFKKPEKVDRPQ